MGDTFSPATFKKRRNAKGLQLSSQSLAPPIPPSSVRPTADAADSQHRLSSGNHHHHHHHHAASGGMIHDALSEYMNMNQATPTVASSGSGGSTSGSTTRNRHPADQEQEEEEEEERIMTPTQASLAVPSIAAIPVPVPIASASTSTSTSSSAAAGGTGKSRISRKKPVDLDISKSLGGGVRKAPVHPLGDGGGGAGTRDELGEKLQGMRVGEVGNMVRTARPTTTMMMTSRHSSSSLAVQDPSSSSNTTTATTTTRKKKPTSSHGPKERETPSSSSPQLTEAGPFGDLRNDEFKVLGDLGAGAGGTVDKVVHVPTGTVMAKKVRCRRSSACVSSPAQPSS